MTTNVTRMSLQAATLPPTLENQHNHCQQKADACYTEPSFYKNSEEISTSDDTVITQDGNPQHNPARIPVALPDGNEYDHDNPRKSVQLQSKLKH